MMNAKVQVQSWRLSGQPDSRPRLRAGFPVLESSEDIDMDVEFQDWSMEKKRAELRAQGLEYMQSSWHHKV
jgi:hypothetical protein